MIYFDQAATSYYRPDCVVTAVIEALANAGNSSRSATGPSIWSSRIVYEAREKIATLFNAKPENVAFTSGVTESLNLVIASFFNKGHIITTANDHNSVLRPLYLRDGDLDLTIIPVDKDGNFDYRARSSVAWDYEGCMYYLKPFREKFAEDRWNTYWILKYQNWNTAESEADPPMSCINERAIRYADVLLLLAESYLRGKQDLPMAIGYLNQIRERANLNPYSGAQTYEAVFNDLERQRAIEFFVEGERFYDLRRWGLLEKRMQTCNEVRYKQLMTGKVGDTNRYYYYPIPSKELETNPLCTPNEGW